jgi:hypothetical protein
VKTKTHFAFRVDIWDDTGDSIVEHVAGVDDFEVAEATYRAAVARSPAARITLRQGIRVVHDTRVTPPALLPICPPRALQRSPVLSEQISNADSKFRDLLSMAWPQALRGRSR